MDAYVVLAAVALGVVTIGGGLFAGWWFRGPRVELAQDALADLEREHAQLRVDHAALQAEFDRYAKKAEKGDGYAIDRALADAHAHGGDDAVRDWVLHDAASGDPDARPNSSPAAGPPQVGEPERPEGAGGEGPGSVDGGDPPPRRLDPGPGGGLG